MINTQYKLTAPLSIEACYQNIDYHQQEILIRPNYLAICKADMRYYFGMREARVLKQRLPMALIHEACGVVMNDPSGQFKTGQKVILLPNIPGTDIKYSENYRVDSLFRSSRADGFMQEMISLPREQVVPYYNIPAEIAAITEFISVGVHAVTSYLSKISRTPERVAVWGDGALGYVVSSLLRYFLPQVHLTVIGTHHTKLSAFQFANERLTIDGVTSNLWFDDTFECVGGQNSGDAVNQMIDTIMPEGIIMLMGVSEQQVPINTRMVLEKGLTLIGRSRSGRIDFEKTVEIMDTHRRFADRMGLLISEVIDVKEISDIHRAFNQSKIVDFKLVMNWNI